MSDNAVITFKEAKNCDLTLEGDNVLVIRVDLSRPTGTTSGGNRSFATTHGNFPIVAGKHKVRLNLNVYE